MLYSVSAACKTFYLLTTEINFEKIYITPKKAEIEVAVFHSSHLKNCSPTVSIQFRNYFIPDIVEERLVFLASEQKQLLVTRPSH